MKPLLQALLSEALSQLPGAPPELPAGLQINANKDPRHGDFATNLAMVLAKPMGARPRELAQQIVDALPKSAQVDRVEIAGPGFINFFLSDAAIQDVVRDIIEQGEAYGRAEAGSRGKILIEYVSANPTGPMHVGHGRGAAYGDSLSRLMRAAGWQVHREYYVNDAGRQVDILTVSVWLRYLESCGEAVSLPARAYPGDYIRQTSERLRTAEGDAYRHPASAVLDGLPADAVVGADASEAERAAAKIEQERHLDALIVRARTLLGDAYPRIQRAALDDQIGAIRATLQSFGVEFDQWYSERSLVDSGLAAKAQERLRESGHVFEQDGAVWLRTSHFGDEKDRVLFKADGAATYFANDLAYHVDKLDRGYPVLLDVWGADHHGYIARVRAAIEALTGRKDVLRVQLMQFVTLSSGRMGKRSGNFVTLQDLIDEAGRDATRFFYLMRSHDQHLEFDIELAQSQSNDNPVYYVQYAHARICSVFSQLAERGQTFQAQAALGSLHRLVEPQEKKLLALLQKYPEKLQAAAEQMSPHQIAFYLRDLADAMHSYYNAHKFLVEDSELQDARLALISATREVLASALALLGVSCPDKM